MVRENEYQIEKIFWIITSFYLWKSRKFSVYLILKQNFRLIYKNDQSLKRIIFSCYKFYFFQISRVSWIFDFKSYTIKMNNLDRLHVPLSFFLNKKNFIAIWFWGRILNWRRKKWSSRINCKFWITKAFPYFSHFSEILVSLI